MATCTAVKVPAFLQVQEKVYQKEREALKHLAKKPVAVIFDSRRRRETTFAEHPHWRRANIPQSAVVKRLQEYNLANDDVIVFHTDDAAYMKKASFT